MGMREEQEKKGVSVKALQLIPKKGIVGLGSGTTIDVLASIINENSENNFICVSTRAQKILEKKRISVIQKGKPTIAFDGFDCIIKQGKKLIALKGAGALDFTNEKKFDYSAKELVLMGGKSKLKEKSCPIFVEVEKKKLREIEEKIKKERYDVRKVPKTNKHLHGKKNSFLYFYPKKSTNFTKLETWLDKQEGIVGNGIFSKKKFKLLVGDDQKKKTRLQVALDFNDDIDAIPIAAQTHKFVDIIEIGTPLVKAMNEKEIIKKLKKYKKDLFVDLKTMDAGYYETKPAITLGGKYVSVLGVASNETIKGVLKNGANKVVVDLICCVNVVERIKELKRIGVLNFEIHSGIDDQGKGKNPLDELARSSEIKGINLWVAGGINLGSLDSIMNYHPAVVVVGGAITRAKDPALVAKKMQKRIEELS